MYPSLEKRGGERFYVKRHSITNTYYEGKAFLETEFQMPRLTKAGWFIYDFFSHFGGHHCIFRT
jgi:hypothetical protein